MEPIEVSNDVGVPYDYQSIMHYDLYSFGRTVNGNKLQTIFPKVPGVAITHIANRPFLSPSDALTVNLTYTGLCDPTLPLSPETLESQNVDDSKNDTKNVQETLIGAFDRLWAWLFPYS